MRYDPSFNPALTCYYQQDHEGSVTHLLNTSGNVIESYKYDAFGLPTIYDGDGTQLSSSAYSNRFLFTGREYANLFGFYEYRARAYHPTLGRFMSEDPKLFDAGDYNLFRYCHNDPLDFTDPMGLELDTSHLDAQEWKTTRAYLMQSRTYGNLILRAEALSQKIVVMPRNDGRDFVGKEKQTTIYWDPHSALETTDKGRQSPALGFGHELDHAVRRETDRKAYERDNLPRSDKQYGRREERRAGENESRAAKELHEDVRRDHNGERYRTASPISRDRAPKASDVERRQIEAGTKEAQKIMSERLNGLQRKDP